MTRRNLEKYQVGFYLAAVVGGLLLGATASGAAGWLANLLTPLLGALLYATFCQIPLVRLRDAFAEPRFLAAAVIGNFVILPLLIWGLIWLAPADPAVRLGILLVLLVPCTDWFITFTQLGGGDGGRALAFTPLSLLLQLILLPLYLWIMGGVSFNPELLRGELLTAFGQVILLPLLAAWLTEAWTKRQPASARFSEAVAWMPVPLLALVVLVIAASQAPVVLASLSLLAGVLPIFLLFLLAAPLPALLLTRLFRLPPAQGRTLAFSFGTRNSFVVLPLALALPFSLQTAVVVVVCQSLVELLGMIAYLRWIPRLFPKQ